MCDGAGGSVGSVRRWGGRSSRLRGNEPRTAAELQTVGVREPSWSKQFLQSSTPAQPKHCPQTSVQWKIFEFPKKYLMSQHHQCCEEKWESEPAPRLQLVVISPAPVSPVEYREKMWVYLNNLQSSSVGDHQIPGHSTSSLHRHVAVIRDAGYVLFWSCVWRTENIVTSHSCAETVATYTHFGVMPWTSIIC